MAMRFWSPVSAPAGRMPGVTSTPAGPVSARRDATSWGEQTKPLIPASRPILASKFYLGGGRALEADGGELGRVHAGEHGYGQKLGRVA